MLRSEFSSDDLNLLVVFVTVFREESVKAAADRLGLGPSAVSMALGRLRERLGDPLFIRSRAGLEPTEVARILHEALGPALDLIGAALTRRAAFDPQRSDRTFRIGLTDDLAATLLPALLCRVRTVGPDLRIDIRAVDFRTAPELLETGSIDAALSAHPAQDRKQIVSEVLYDEDFVVVAARHLRLREPLTLESYLSLHHCLISASGRPWGVIDTSLAEQGLRRRVTTTLQSFLPLPFILERAELAVSMPRRSGDALAARFGLDIRALPFPSPRFPVGLSWHRRTDTDTAQMWLRREIVAAVRGAGEWQRTATG